MDARKEFITPSGHCPRVSSMRQLPINQFTEALCWQAILVLADEDKLTNRETTAPYASYISCYLENRVVSIKTTWFQIPHACQLNFGCSLLPRTWYNRFATDLSLECVPADLNIPLIHLASKLISPLLWPLPRQSDKHDIHDKVYTW